MIMNNISIVIILIVIIIMACYIIGDISTSWAAKKLVRLIKAEFNLSTNDAGTLLTLYLKKVKKEKNHDAE